MGHIGDRTTGSDPERFRVEVGELRKVGRQLRDLGSTGGEAATYASTHVDFDPSGGAVIERFVDVTTGMDTGVRDLMKDIQRSLHGSGAELVASADRYERLDERASRRLDRNYWKD